MKMLDTLNNISKFWNEHVKSILVLTLLVLCVVLFFSIRGCTQRNNEAASLKNSIEAIYSQVEYYKGKNNELIASKKVLEGNLEVLKINNKELYDKLESMKQKDADRVVYVETVIENPPDTIYWELDHNKDSLEVKPFNFSNEWRTLEGYIMHSNNQLGLNITRDQVYFDYTLALKDNEVFMTSSNPYVKYKEISGLVVPNYIYRKKHWHIGPSITGGYDVINRKWGLQIGIGIQYDLISF